MLNKSKLSKALLKSALSLLKSICNNDSVKCEATKLNCVFLIIQVLSKYCANPFVRDQLCCFQVKNLIN